MRDDFGPASGDEILHEKEMRRLMRRNKNMDHSSKYPSSKEEKKLDRKMMKELRKSRKHHEDPMD